MSDRISTIAVLGAGTMGRGIAHVAALAGYRTHLHDPQADALSEALSSIAVNLDKGVSKGKVDRTQAEAAKRNLVSSGDLSDAVSEADLVIEAVPESIELKTHVFNAVEPLAPDHAIFASNTSGLSITELAATTTRAARFAGMHFFNPVHIMRLIELVRGRETADETIEILTEVGRRMGKETITVNESPGFVTSRINALIGNEAFRMLEKDVASAEDIDTALKLGLNHPMGPFEMVDLVGLDVRLSILEYLHSTLGDLYRPSQLLRDYVRAGRLGRKVGRGVYSYDANGRRSG
jgi:3-hydroxybutyryl-CoA dehydrogenase